MKRYILKNSAGRYFTISNGIHTSTANLELACTYDHDRAMNRALAFNRDHDDTMKLVPYDTEVLAYYPICAHHCADQTEALKRVRLIELGEADGQYSAAHAVCLQGLWFVYARKEAVSV